MKPTNREQRRHPEKLDRADPPRGRPEDAVPGVSPQDRMRGADRVQDDLDPRAKSSGHGKKTADKWNQ